MTEGSFRIIMHALVAIFSMTLAFLRGKYGSAKTTETVVEAVNDIQRRRQIRKSRAANGWTRSSNHPSNLDS